jgi:probable F420-dependent oxidoreductase
MDGQARGDGLLRLGFGLPVSGSWATPDAMVHVARRAEELGYASLWTFQRLLVPAGRDLGPAYRSVLDPVVALASVAAATRTIRLGTALVNALFTPPVVLAKQLATLDAVSGGRLDAGLGLGWVREEFAAVGVPYESRGARMDDYLRCLRAIWTGDVVSYDGPFYSVPPARALPRPVQRPHPPLLLGGAALAALRRAGRFADGWISSSKHDLTRIGTDGDVVRRAAAEAGKDPAAVRVVVRGLVDLSDAVAEGSRRPLHGSAAQVRGDLDALAEQGVTEVFLDLNFSPRVGSPDADVARSLAYADGVLEAFAPVAAPQE